MLKDISPVLDEWEYKPEEIRVRKITGLDGHEYLQMRLDLGLLQMRMDGRPDGQRPNGHVSLLEHYAALLERHRQRTGSDRGFSLDAEDCKALRQEALQYYYRYLSLYQLADYDRVVRDTARNLKVVDLVSRYAESDSDRWSLEQYRPYITMMHTRGKALGLLARTRHSEAMEAIQEGIARIEQFLRDNDREDVVDQCPELQFLRQWLEEIDKERPLDEVETLQRQLSEAVEREQYELAAELRDRLRVLAPNQAGRRL